MPPSGRWKGGEGYPLHMCCMLCKKWRLNYTETYHTLGSFPSYESARLTLYWRYTIYVCVCLFREYIILETRQVLGILAWSSRKTLQGSEKHMWQVFSASFDTITVSTKFLMWLTQIHFRYECGFIPMLLQPDGIVLRTRHIERIRNLINT